jgi:Protein of unknown function (DUF2844)
LNQRNIVLRNNVPNLPAGVRKTLVLMGMLGLAGLIPGVASATLGEPVASVTSDSASMQGSIKVEERSIYRLHEIRLPSGSSVREYVTLDGNVFAVAWSGPVVPDLRQTLGKYYEAFLSGAESKSSPGHRVDVQQDDVVIQTGGHMRALFGRAYLRSAVPSGVDAGELR